MAGWQSALRAWANVLKRDVLVLWLAARDPRVPWYAKALAGAVAAYALSPIDLIPDFIPVLGYLDDLLIVPAGIFVAVRLIPPDVLTELRHLAEQQASRPRSIVAMGMIVGIWLVAGAAIAWAAWRRFA